MWDVSQQACECAAYSNPVPHVLMLTAIVVGVATTALGLALVVRIQEAYGTTEEDDIARLDQERA
jgi:multicomponent Na+:H+ antiporter subunit C